MRCLGIGLIVGLMVTASLGVANSATFIVTDEADSGPGTLREAIGLANANPDKDLIKFNLPVDMSGDPLDISLTSGTLLITNSVNIFNQGGKQVTVRRDMAAADFGVFEVDAASVIVSMMGLNVFNGATSVGGGLLVNSSTAKVRLGSMHFKNNQATASGSGNGGAIHNIGDLYVINSTFESNTAAEDGGAISNRANGVARIFQSTFSGNLATTSAGGDGGAIEHRSDLPLTVLFSTFCENQANDRGGGIVNNDTIFALNSNILADNGAADGEDLRDVGTITTAKKNVVKSPNGHTLDPTMNQIGGDPGCPALGDYGGPVPTRGPPGTLSPPQDQGSNEEGLRYDQRGGFRNRGLDPDAGAVESDNFFFFGEGDWDDPGNWSEASVPGPGDAAWTDGDFTLSGDVDVIDLNSLGVAWAGGVNAESNWSGADFDVTALNELAIGWADSDHSPHASAHGTLDLADSEVQAGTLSVGFAEAPLSEGSAEASGSFTLNNQAAKSLTVTDTTAIGVAAAFGGDSSARADAVVVVDAEFIALDALIIGEAVAESFSDATVDSASAAFDAEHIFTTDSLTVASAISFGGDVEITANDFEVTATTVNSGQTTIGSAQVSAISGAQTAHIGEVNFDVTATDYTISSSLNVGTVSPGTGTADIEIVRAGLNIEALMAEGINVGSSFLAGAGTGTIGDARLDITTSDTAVVGPTNIGALTTAAGATAIVSSAVLNIQGGSYSSSGFGANLRIGVVDAFTPVAVVQTTATARFEDAFVQIGGDVVIAVVNSAGADAASFAHGELWIINSEVGVTNDIRVSFSDGVAAMDTTAIIGLNPSLLSIGGDLLLGDGATTQFSIEGLTRPSIGVPGEYGAIDATNATLDGELSLAFDFPAASAGDMFELIRIDGLGMFDGFFDLTTVSGLPLGLTAEAMISGNSVLATIVAAPIPGDGNGDGWVDGLDYLLWAGNFGTHPGSDGDASDGDYNDDGWVDGLDYLLWAGNFGTHATTNVPEPMACAMLVCGAIMIVAGRSIFREE